jgi:hypothetical protein
MADVSLADLGSSSNPLGGLDPSDYAGYGAGGNISNLIGTGSDALMSPLSLGALGAGAVGMGALISRGVPQLPPQSALLQGQVPSLLNQGSTLFNEGQASIGQGQQALQMAQAGKLTPEQQAQLGQFSTGLTNQSRQMFYSMGRNPDADTAAITQQANVDAQVNAMAQQQIQTTLALGFGEISAGTTMTGQGLQFTNAGDQILYQIAQQQISQNNSFNSALTSAFGAIGSMFAKAAPLVLAA